MFRIKDNNIVLTRGDTLRCKLSITTKDGMEYVPSPDDVIRFAMKRSYNDYCPIINKEIPSDTLILKLEPEDTKDLKMGATYVYDIQITMSDGTVDTFISRKLKLTEEVD